MTVRELIDLLEDIPDADCIEVQALFEDGYEYDIVGVEDNGDYIQIILE